MWYTGKYQEGLNRCIKQLPAIDSKAYPIATVTVLGHFRRTCGAAGEEYSHGLMAFCVHTNMVS